ncbi:MAG: hypothetical protein QMD12_02170 [Candidatus Aenigmarchaeota archaeon]|nr:hypothetical protein [Candidatus Aenigmarchaeota archaeon]
MDQRGKIKKISKLEVLKTLSGFKLAFHKIYRSSGIEQFEYYEKLGKELLGEFKKRLLQKISSYIKEDKNPLSSINNFAEEMGFSDLRCESESEARDIREKLLKTENLNNALTCILDSKFISDTAPAFIAISDGVCRYKKLNIPKTSQHQLIFAALEGLLTSNCIDSNIDKDEDLELLNEFKLVGSKAIRLARKDCLEAGGEQALELFNNGLKDGNIGQHEDRRIKENPSSISREKMETCFHKYNPIGTAAQILSWDQEPLAEINYRGGCFLGKAAGVIDDFQDALEKNKIDIPSWQFYHIYLTKNVKKGLRLALEEGKNYIKEGEKARDMLPSDYSILPFLGVTFLALDMQLHVFYKRTMKKSYIFDSLF